MMSNEQDGGPTHDAPQNGYLNRKKVSLDQNQRNGIHPYRPGILYRLGEAYLNYAEALNECDPGNPDILKYLNLIRERAGMPQYGTGKDSNGFDKIPLNGQDEVREAIYHERRVELCCENGLRYLDLRRWKKAEEVLNQPMYGMNLVERSCRMIQMMMLHSSSARNISNVSTSVNSIGIRSIKIK